MSRELWVFYGLLWALAASLGVVAGALTGPW